jgi:hypothetical protein
MPIATPVRPRETGAVWVSCTIYLQCWVLSGEKGKFFAMAARVD